MHKKWAFCILYSEYIYWLTIVPDFNKRPILLSKAMEKIKKDNQECYLELNLLVVLVNL